MVPAFFAILVKGGPVMIPLACCSVVSLAVIIERAWFWWRLRVTGDAERTLELAAAGKWEDAVNVADASRFPLARALAANPELTVIVNADQDVAHGRVVSVLDEVRGAGIGRLASAVNPDKGRRAP